MSNCTHDLTEREVACADGMCPMCLAAENERLRGLLQGIPSFILEPRWYGNQEWAKRIDAALGKE